MQDLQSGPCFPHPSMPMPKVDKPLHQCHFFFESKHSIPDIHNQQEQKRKVTADRQSFQVWNVRQHTLNDRCLRTSDTNRTIGIILTHINLSS